MESLDPSYEYVLQTPRRGRHFEVDQDHPQASPCTPPRAPWPTPMTPPRTPLKPLQFCEYSDRLIPSRAGSNMETGFDLLTENHGPLKLPGQPGGDPSAFARLLRNELLGPSPGSSDREELRTPERGLFRYKSQPEEMESLALLSASTTMESPCKVARRFPAAPYKVLSAPGLEDDYYLNLLDWSSDDLLAVGLNRDVDLWNATTGRASRLCELDTSVCSLKWARRSSSQLALGLGNGDVQIWDAAQAGGGPLQCLRAHRRRCCALSWVGNWEVFSGSQDTSILRWDLREPCDGRPAQRLAGHSEEVCGLSWSDDLQLLASGGNEGHVFLWDRSGRVERRLCSHQAACKALDWSPRGVLATGGGTADRSICLWNTSGMQLAHVDTDAQVCNLAWSLEGELISTHGFSTCEVSIWKSHAGGLSQLHSFHWHQARVLYLAMSPDGQSAAMGTGNEMLCFWHLYPKHIKASPASSSSLSISEGSSLSRTIR